MSRKRPRRGTFAVTAGISWEPNGEDGDAPNYVCYEIEFRRTILYYRDRYGEDADGNRGIDIDCFEDEDQTDITVDGEADRTKWPRPESEVLAAIEQFLIDVPPEEEAGDYEEPEPDWDRIAESRRERREERA